jgi:hypothetical protein
MRPATFVFGVEWLSGETYGRTERLCAGAVAVCSRQMSRILSRTISSRRLHHAPSRYSSISNTVTDSFERSRAV